MDFVRCSGFADRHSLILLVCSSLCLAQKTKTVLVTAEEEKLRDPLGYSAMMELHRQMDADESGDIDRTESKGFMGKADIAYGAPDRAKREMAFHHNNDDKVDLDEFWEAWFASNERSWTTSELVSWLENSVKLPQYSNAVISKRLDGRSLPRMALLNSSFLTDTLGVKSMKDKKKIVIKALDLVLFGFTDDSSSRVKDAALSVLAILLITVLVFLRKQSSRSRQELEDLSKKLTQLKTMESNFEDAQKSFEEERKRRQSACEAVENEQVATLRDRLNEAERLLESNNSAPLALQPLLIRTCELEMSYIGQQRLECIAEMSEAIELIEKLRKKQSSIISSIKLATGASVGTDQVDSRIFSLKSRMEKISLTMASCQRRWAEIESLCGFQVMVPASGPEMNFMASTSPLANLSHSASAASQFARGSATVPPSVCSVSSTDTKSLTASVSSLVPLENPSRPKKLMSRAVATSNSYPLKHQVLPSSILGQHSFQLGASYDDLRIRTLAASQRLQQQKYSAPPDIPSEGSSSLATAASLPPSIAESAVMENEDLSHQSNSSVCSTSSNEDEKENGAGSRKGSSRSVPKKMKFHFFRRTKYSA